MNLASVAQKISLECSIFQVAALGAVSNIVVDFTTAKSTFLQCGGLKLLVQLSKSMDPILRLNALWGLRNLMFLADNTCKKGIFLELTAPSLLSLICGNDQTLFVTVVQILAIVTGYKPLLIAFTVQTLSLLSKSKHWLLFAILLMDVQTLQSMCSLKMALYQMLQEDNCRVHQRPKLGYRLEVFYS